MEAPENKPCVDPIVEAVVSKLRSRSRVGVDKYKTTLDRDDLSLDQWLQHLQEELMDASNYIEVIRNNLAKKD